MCNAKRRKRKNPKKTETKRRIPKRGVLPDRSERKQEKKKHPIKT